MGQTINAIYEDGKLTLLEPVELYNGQVVQITILTERDRLRAILGDLVVQTNLSKDDEDFDEKELMREIEEGTKGVTLSDIIIQERNEGM